MFSSLTRTQPKTLDALPLGTGAAGDRQARRWHGRAPPHRVALPSNHVAQGAPEHARHAPACVSTPFARAAKDQRKIPGAGLRTPSASRMGSGAPLVSPCRNCVRPGLRCPSWLNFFRLLARAMLLRLSSLETNFPFGACRCLGSANRAGYFGTRTRPTPDTDMLEIVFGMVGEERACRLLTSRPRYCQPMHVMLAPCTIYCPRNKLTECHSACSPGRSS
jgi:hypothetical protein